MCLVLRIVHKRVRTYACTYANAENRERKNVWEWNREADLCVWVNECVSIIVLRVYVRVYLTVHMFRI